MDSIAKIAVCQMLVGKNRDNNLAKAVSMIREAAESGADFAVLPEMFVCPYSSKYFIPAADAGCEDILQEISAIAKEKRIYVVAGSIPEREGEYIYNSSFVFDRNGSQIARHRKVHLFDIHTEQNTFRESDTFSAGEQITVFETEYGRMGLAICFDLRFAELNRAMASRGAKAVFLPAQFTKKTGEESWSMLLRARASDNQIFYIGASAARSEVGYQCWGHSMVVDPFSKILSSCDETEQILFAEINLDDISAARNNLPVFTNLRRDLYPVAE